MSLQSWISELEARKQKITAAIETLERLEQQPLLPLKSRRGRKFMDKAERQVVSIRMKKYWASRRKA